MKPSLTLRNRLPVLAATALLGLTTLVAAPAAAAIPAPSTRETVATQAAPQPVPIDEIVPGMTGTGLTVSRGRTPEPFSVTVLGVLPDAIGIGVDMIVFEASSPALDAAGGIWGGMSGSPVYAGDGRLLGAVSYGFTAAPSMIGGMTPAVAMLELLSAPQAAPAGKAHAKVALPDKLRGDLVASGRATEAQTAIGLEPLRIPLAVSGLNATRLAAFNAELERSGSPMRAYAGSAAPSAPAPAGAIVPGGNFVVAQSYGDVTMGAIGTVTAVVGTKVLAFGHPMTFAGPVSMSAHAGTAIAVVRDNTFGSFKMATVDGIAGTVTQDRMVGVLAQLGSGPRAVPITSTVRSGTTERTVTSYATMDIYAPNLTAQQLLGNFDRVFNRIGPGRATISWTVRGTRNGGIPWTLTRTNRYASTYDIAQDSLYEVANQISTVISNEFTAVRLTSVTLNGTVVPDYGSYTADATLADYEGSWTVLTSTCPVEPGQPLDLRVRLRSYRGTSILVPVRFDVPAGTVFGGSLSVTGRAGVYNGTPTATSFPELLAALRNAPRNNELAIQLRVAQETGEQVATQVITLDEIVSGQFDYSVTTD